jgi:HK97 family phage portal protein
MKNLLTPFMSSDTTEVFHSDSTRYLDLFSSRGSVSVGTAQKIADVFACINLKANAMALLPLKLYIVTENGKKENKSHSLYRLLRKEPNPNLTAFEWKKMISQDLDLRGNHYAQLIKNGLGEIVAIYPLKADLMTVSYALKNNNKEKIYNYNGTLIPADRILHIIDIPDNEGLVGISRIAYARQTLEFANNAATHGNKLFKNQATPSGAFTNPSELSDQAFERLKTQLEEKYSGLENSGKPLLLEGGLTFSPISISNSDSQWLESRKLNRENIGAIFGVPTSMLNDSTASSYGNLEQKYLEFQTNTILPILIAIEEKAEQKLLNKSEKSNLIIKFQFNALLRADVKTKAEYYKNMWGIGSMNPNEIRSYEDMNSYDGGDEYFMQLSYAPVSRIISGEATKDLKNFTGENKQ